jgi:hypothetical protein
MTGGGGGAFSEGTGGGRLPLRLVYDPREAIDTEEV